ncbi:eCIS core domain-containing protein [Verrucosispora sp. TAA-831]|uniref:eCIS core domain-containing protein n=1 Tax=Verrucosispora sp. TAA-831 TaxID=3422227 RepID=UPI003D6E3999
MRAHDPAGRDVAARPVTPTRPETTGAEQVRPEAGAASVGPTGVGPGGAAATILDLQHRAGNAAATLAVQRMRCADPDHGHESEPVQRSAVNQVLRSSGSPLAGPVRQDMEARLGADFSDVRLHTGALAERSAAEVDARAFTSGSHVVLGRGGSDRHTLAHELTHVIQQRSGPVAGTDNGHGQRVSDPGDAFERAAEANAHRALSTPPPAHDVHQAPQAAMSAPIGSAAGAAVQRVGADELHREPTGPSVQVRGPRRSRSNRRPATQVDQAAWNQLATAYQAATEQAPYKERIRLDTDLTSLSEMSPPGTGYQLGTALTNVAQQVGITLAGGVTGARSNAEMMEELGRLDPASLPYWQAQDARDQQLAADAVNREAQYQNESGPENAQARRDVTVGLLRGIQMPAADATDMLLTFNDGLVIGGAHRAEPFFAWAVDHMARLHQNGVRTLYLESLREDAHQRLVDEYLAGGVMSRELTNFCNTYQRSHAVDLAGFLAEARSAGMRVKGTGGRPARQVGTNIHNRAVLLNTYGEQVVRRDRAQTVASGGDPGKYLMQAGESHAGTHTNRAPTSAIAGGVALPNRFPGIDELLDVPAVRLEDNMDGRKGFRAI